jgi:hypothetical protein
VATIEAHRRDAGRDHLPFAVGALAGAVYVGTPAWDLGAPAISGDPAKIAHILSKIASPGASQVQIRFRSRDVSEAETQMRLFGEEVLPLLG